MFAIYIIDYWHPKCRLTLVLFIIFTRALQIKVSSQKNLTETITTEKNKLFQL